MPNLGNETLDNSYTRSMGGTCIDSLTMGEDGNVVSMWVYINAFVFGTAEDMYAALYDGPTTGANLLVQDAGPVNVTTADVGTWKEIPLDTYAISNGQGFILAEAIPGGSAEIQAATGLAGGSNPYTGHNSYTAPTAGAWPANPSDAYSRGSARNWNRYLEYSVGGGGGGRVPRKRRAIGNVPMGALLQLHRRGVEVVTCDSLARERARSRIVNPGIIRFEKGGLNYGYLRGDLRPPISGR